MSIIQKIFAYNTGSLISGTTQVGDIAISEADVEYSDDFAGLQWWGGPDETFGWVIAHTDPSGSHNGEPGIPAYLGFWRSNGLTDQDFLDLCNSIPPRIGFPPFTNTSDASTWLYNNGYWTSFNSTTPTPTPTETLSVTPTPTSTPTMYYYSVSGYSCGVSCTLVGSYTVMSPTPLTIGYFYNNPENRGYTFEILSLIPAVGGAYDLTGEPGYADCVTACVGVTPTPTVTQTPTLTPTLTPTTTETPTLTPTPSVTAQPVTGYSFNLIQLPYNYPASGNTIMTGPTGSTSGTTNPNQMTSTNRGIYFNAIDTDGIDRTSYFSQFTGQSITITMSQTGSTAIYSGDSKAFQSWSGNTGDPLSPIAGKGFVFGYGISQPGYTSGTTVLIQSAPTDWATGQTVYISASLNGPGVTPTPTATSVTPTPTPTSGYTSDGWFFYSPDNEPVLNAPLNNGDTTFINTGGGNGTYNPNYTGGTLSLYFNNNNSAGTSYASQFSTLVTAGGTMTISQGSSTVIYSGTSTDYQSAGGTFTFLNVTRSAQMIQSASTPFVSGSTINVVVS